MAAMNENRVLETTLLERYDPIDYLVQLTNTHIYTGAICTAVAGKARPALANTAGQTLLGFAYQEYVATGADKTWNPRMVFLQGVGLLFNSATDPVVDADAGKDVYLTDDQSVHHTNAGNDVAVRFKGFDPATGMCRCVVRNP